MTQRKIILRLLEENPDKWFLSYELLKVSTKFGWIGSQGDRRARELASEGLIEVRHENKYAEYRYKRIISPLEIGKDVFPTQPKFDPHFAVTSFKQASML